MTRLAILLARRRSKLGNGISRKSRHILSRLENIDQGVRRCHFSESPSDYRMLMTATRLPRIYLMHAYDTAVSCLHAPRATRSLPISVRDSLSLRH